MSESKGRSVSLILIGCLIVSRAAFAYETPTHLLITQKAYERSDLSQAPLQRKLGLGDVIDSRIFRPAHTRSDVDFDAVVPTCDFKSKMRLKQLLLCGAMYEDVPGVRSVNHFFDSSTGRPLTILGVATGATSPDWALEDKRNLGNQFSYVRARSYFRQALTRTGPPDASGGRYENWALLFQTLGQIVHHVQDMTQPQHVRNDAHQDTFNNYLLSLGVLHPSRFEKHTRNEGNPSVVAALMQGFVPVYPALAETFPVPRAFWVGGNLGLAEYTNRNFVSAGTKFVASGTGNVVPDPNFPSPTPTGRSTESIESVFGVGSVPPAIAQMCSRFGIQKCEITFFSNQWLDPISGASVTNPRAATLALFDEDLNHAPVAAGVRVTSLNRLNFETVYQYLVPRAAAYSAGLINYFFRGEMDIALPSEGVYAMIDHKTERCIDVCGFRTLKLKVTNRTPNEDMSGGSLVAVVKFHRNSCYRDDLKGEPGGPAFGGVSCRTPEEEIVVSTPNPVTLLSSGSSVESTFSFPEAVPINATDVYLQVVFAGQLGAEPGAVAVATKDISEPNYVSVANVTDMVYGYSDDRFHGFPYLGYNARDTIYNLSVAFGANANPLATLAQMTAPGHAQLSFLTDPGDQYVDFRYASHNYTVSSFRGNVPVSEFFGVPSSSLYGRTVAFASSRGVVRNIHIFHRLPADWSLYDCVAEPELCTQSTMPSFTPDSASGWTIAFPTP